MENIYDQFDAAFRKVAAYCFVHPETQQQINVCFKYPADGAGRLYCYVHFVHAEMVRGFAGGYGYDKTSAAFINAVNKIEQLSATGSADFEYRLKMNTEISRIQQVIGKYYNGQEWDRLLHDLGYKKHNVIC